MDWLRAHSFHAGAIALVILLLFGSLFLWQPQNTSQPQGQSSSWRGNGVGFFNLFGATAPQNNGRELPDIYGQIQVGPPFTYIPYTREEESTGEPVFDFDAYIALLSGQKNDVGSPALDTSLLDETYSLIPTGLIASAPEKEFSPVQQSLHDYGNAAGSFIQSFERRNMDMAKILRDQFEDPGNASKNDALIGLADGMTSVGNTLEKLATVPETARSANLRLAQSYKEMGETLAEIPGKRTEAELLNAMTTYNAAVEGFIKNYLALATLFSLSEVTFLPEEAGSVFMFSGSSSF